MRRVKFIVPMLLFAGACNAPSMVEPAAVSREQPSTSIMMDSTSTPEAPVEEAPERDGGIMIGTGT